MRFRSGVLVVLPGVLGFVAVGAAPRAVRPVVETKKQAVGLWPAAKWATAQPADVGLNKRQLVKARDYALTGGGSGYITRHGKLVMAWGDPARRYDLKSTTKSIGVTALGLAIADGKIRLTDRAVRYQPQLAVPPVSNKKTGWIRRITIQQLATQTAGFEKSGGYTKLVFEPGTKWSYSDGGPNWLAECITLAYKRDIQSLLFERVFTPIGITTKDLRWRANAYRPRQIKGIERREFGSGISANVDAMARMGYLYLRGGRWDGKQIIPKEFVTAAGRTVKPVVGLPEVDPKRYGNASDHYGLLWWNNADGRLKNVPHDAFWSWGLYDSLIVVIPSLDIVVARAGRSWKRAWGGHYDVLRPFFEPIAVSAAVQKTPRAKPEKREDTRADAHDRPSFDKLPYPPSPVVKGIEWAAASTIIRRAPGSDNWPTTWGDDGNLYTAYGDGRGFRPFVEKKLSLGLARVSGDPLQFTGINIRSKTAEQFGDGVRGRKASGLLMVDGVLYMLVRNSGNAQLAWSKDHGKTWTWADWKFTTGLGAPTFLNFGRNYSGARDGYVYIYSHDSGSAYKPADRMVLARVPKEKLSHRASYTFFRKLDANEKPLWTREIENRGAVFVHPARCYRSGITYNAGLRRYFWCQTIPKGDTRFSGGFAIYDAPEPWGPWTTVYFTPHWDVGPGETSAFPTKWISSDGKTVHLVFSGNDCFSVRKATLRLRSPQHAIANTSRQTGFAVQNGWYVQDGKVIWGYAQHNGWWRVGQRPNLARRAPGEIGPNRTEDLDKLTDAMLRFAYPGFEHNYGLWYDRRRDKHDTARRTNANVVSPFLEQPWARSGQGTAWDGLSKYDLTKYNDWYFNRLKQFADLCDRKGTILFHNCYMQHALLENQAHYADFPWRPANCIQPTKMPDRIPAANVFYDVSNPLRRKLHRMYIRKCLDVLGNNTNVVFLCGEEYTGPRSFMQFWLDTVLAWEKETGRRVHIGLGATKDVLDAILAEPKYAAAISTIDLRYWWYRPDGKRFAPRGGRQVAGRFTFGVEKTTPAQFHRQIKEYRLKYPNKALLHTIPGTRQHALAALMAGGSMLIGQMPYPGLKDPPRYISPARCLTIQPAYEFVRRHLPRSLPQMTPRDLIQSDGKTTWCLADPGRAYLVYAMQGGTFRLDLSAAKGSLRSKWFNPRTGNLADAGGGSVKAGGLATFTAPDNHDWILWLSRDARHASVEPAVIDPKPQTLHHHRTRVSIAGRKWRLNGRVTYPGTKAEGLMMNVRMVNAVFEDGKRPRFDPETNTDEFIRKIPDYAEHGVRAFTICLQGGYPGYEGAVNSAFRPDGSLRDNYLRRVRRVIEACDRHGMVVILGCYYQRQDQILKNERAVETGLVNVARWIRQNGFTNVVLEVANEFGHRGFDHRSLQTSSGQVRLIGLAKRTARRLLVSTSGGGSGTVPDNVARAGDFLLVHFNSIPLADIPKRIAGLKKYGKPIVCNEDDRSDNDSTRAAHLAVTHGVSWGFMRERINQRFPFRFGGAADAPAVYKTLQQLTSKRNN